MNRTTRHRPGSFLLLSVLIGATGWMFSPPALAQQTEPPRKLDAAENRGREESTVAGEIAALRHLHAASRRAGRKLVTRGESVLPELHQALLAPAATDEQRIQLATVLGEIGDPSSVEPLIQLAGAHPGHLGIRQEVLSMLAELPQSPAAVAFADRVLENPEEHYLVQRKALVYFGQHRDERARRWVDPFVHRSEIDLRATAVFLAARLGHPSAGEWAEELLAGVVPPSARYALLLAYAEVATPEEFERHTPDYMKKSMWEYDSALRISRFRGAGREERLALSGEMMKSRSVYEQKIAARLILREQGAEALAEFIDPRALSHRGAVARNQLRQAGYRVISRDGRVVVERKDSQ